METDRCFYLSTPNRFCASLQCAMAAPAKVWCSCQSWSCRQKEFVERSLHVLGHYLHKSKRKSLGLALQKLKDELMLMGFISLTITIITVPVSKVCVKSSAYNAWTPCDISKRPAYNSSYPSTDVNKGRRRLLAAAVGTSYCNEGYEPFVSLNTLHQLHILIFVLACVHVAYSCLTMALSLTKVYTWGKWEREAHEAVAQSNVLEFTSSVSYSRQSTFVRYHSKKPLGVKFLVWVVCFFKQFHVRRSDYLTLRLSFVTTHNLRDGYDFHGYIIRCIEDEFEMLVSISLYLWAFVIGYLLFSLKEPTAHYWIAMVPLAIVLIIGTKLQHVISTLALENSGVNGPFVGVLLKPRDQLFWFNKPKFLLYIMHFVLFDSALELAVFIWHVWQFGFKTCLLQESKAAIYFSLFVGVLTQLVCCFITLPLYALVSQMSTMPKKAFLPKQVMRGLQRWHEDAKHRLKIKVMEQYRTQRLAKKSVTPLDEQYFLSQSDVPGMLAITGGHINSSPMNVIMEEGATYRVSNRGAMGIEGPPRRYNDQVQSSIYRVSPRIHDESAGQSSSSDGNRDQHSNGLLKPPVPYADLRKRASPRSPMDLNIPPFQALNVAPSPRVPPLQRSSTTR